MSQEFKNVHDQIFEELPAFPGSSWSVLAEPVPDGSIHRRTDHQNYFERNGGFDPTMVLVCERFVLIEDFYSQCNP